jgi:hypothetical protein
MDAWAVIPKSMIAGILDTVRTRILEFVLAVENIEPTAGDVGPGAAAKVAEERITQIFNTTVQGGVAAIGTTGNASIRTGNIDYSATVRDENREELAQLLAELREQANQAALEHAERDEALGAVRNIEQQLTKQKPVLERINSYLAIYASLVTVAAPTVDTLQKLLPYALGALAGQ